MCVVWILSVLAAMECSTDQKLTGACFEGNINVVQNITKRKAPIDVVILLGHNLIVNLFSHCHYPVIGRCLPLAIDTAIQDVNLGALKILITDRGLQDCGIIRPFLNKTGFIPAECFEAAIAGKHGDCAPRASYR